MEKNDAALKVCTAAVYELNHKIAGKLHVSDDQMFDIVAMIKQPICWVILSHR